MTYGELKLYVTEAIGEDILTFDKVIAGIRAGFGDMIHRGYRNFNHLTILDERTDAETELEKITRIKNKKTKQEQRFKQLNPSTIITKFPDDALELLYVKVFFSNRSFLAIKLALTNPSIQAKKMGDHYVTDFNELDYSETPIVVYYKKGNELVIEWDILKRQDFPTKIELGYYQDLPAISESYLRKQLNISYKDPLDIEDLELPLPNDYANILVNYMIWYTALSAGWEQEVVTVLKNEYKYSMEDLLARRNKEDQYDETISIIKIDTRL